MNDICELVKDVILNVLSENCIDNENNLVNIEDGEILILSDDEDDEKMDFD